MFGETTESRCLRWWMLWILATLDAGHWTPAQRQYANDMITCQMEDVYPISHLCYVSAGQKNKLWNGKIQTSDGRAFSSSFMRNVRLAYGGLCLCILSSLQLRLFFCKAWVVMLSTVLYCVGNPVAQHLAYINHQSC